MTMENNELNNKIFEKVINRVVISNLESEKSMKLNRKKRILSLTAVVIFIFTGGLFTVNATTNGEVAQKIKDAISVVFVNNDGKEEPIKGTTYTDSNNHVIEKYEIEKNGEKSVLEVDKTNLDNQNLTIKANTKIDGDKEEINMTIEEKSK